MKARAANRYTGLVDKYRDRLPIGQDTAAVTLCEGDTPLVRLDRVERELGRDVKLYAKLEGQNPTGSFKDRGMTVAVTRAVEEGARAVVCASTGNTAASAAAYAARAGLTAFVLVPADKVAPGKLAQAMVHGAVVLAVAGSFDDAMAVVKTLGEDGTVTVVNSISPFRLQGQKTVAFEVIEELGRTPDYHCVPVGNAGNIAAHWIGYSECCPGRRSRVTGACAFCQGRCPYATRLTDERPVMVGYQAAGAAPFLRGHPVKQPETVASAIRIGDPQSWDFAWSAVKESGGWFEELTDEDLLATQRLLATREGIFCEPASAISVAGAMRDVRSGRIPEGSIVVCTVTGHGLKDPESAVRQCPEPIAVEASEDAVRAVILDRIR
ncbi:MAG: threonine synthase [Ectothiorhodospiraceae bacterium]|nr:threonine synthase [Chromatiales bacterium]MCP5153951.1 threonine synthase [Ectothiorhodospiraceae bacterium]